MKKEVAIVLLVGLILMVGTSVEAFSITEFYKKAVKNVVDFITWKAGICTPTTEGPNRDPTCSDNEDNDCDGDVDDSDSDCWICVPDDTRQCTSSNPGICAPGTQTCNAGTPIGGGSWGDCISNIDVGEFPEVCDGLDNNCDGIVDEGCESGGLSCIPDETQVCDTGNDGVCGAGTQTCDLDGNWGSCEQDNEAISEVCDDGLDNNCDGNVDEDCGEDEELPEGGDCSSGDTTPCTTGQSGICGSGTRTCNSDDSWGICIRNNNPSTEDCNNNLDDDCDGVIDSSDYDCGGDNNPMEGPPNNESLPEGTCKLNGLEWEPSNLLKVRTLKLITEGNCISTQFQMNIYESDLFFNDFVRDVSWYNGEDFPRLEISLDEDLEEIAGGLFEGNSYEIIAKVKVAEPEGKSVKSKVWKVIY